MANLKLTRNLGTADAKRYGLSREQAMEGKEINVTGDARDSLIARKLAVDLKAVPVSDVETAKEDKPDFDSMNLDDLRTFAKENEIEGVTTSLNKEDTLKAVKKGFNKVR